MRAMHTPLRSPGCDPLRIFPVTGTPTPATVAGWIRRVLPQENFRFTAKIYKGLTHDRSLSDPAWRAEIDRLKEAFAGLLESGRLGALLAQFPFSFHCTNEAKRYLARLVTALADFPLAVELRHASWLSSRLVSWLGEQGVGYCNVDQPRIGASISGTAEACGGIGYVRLHGRNREKWFGHASVAERYDYLYEVDELAPWVERIRSIDARTKTSYVIANNHFEGKALVNALELRSVLEEGPVQIPPTLLASYPRLNRIAGK